MKEGVTVKLQRPIRIGVYVTMSVLFIGMFTGCGPARRIYDGLYAELREEPHTYDQRVLAGRRIVIDPGHGGCFEGAIGVDSLTEADVNLGVALYLWGLLKEAGAEVVLTRTTDRDFLPEGSSELRDDLEGRMRIANESAPDIFISIHHNANLPVDREVNKIEVYYRSDDTEASLALARDIRLHLARNLGIEETEIKPGNYYVLRNSCAGASILGEASYLSHPIVEQRLKLADKQRMEAESYFLGMISYFSRGVPSIERVAPAGDTLLTAAEIAFAVKEGGGVPLDISSAKISIGGREVPSYLEPESGTIRYAMDADAPNGTYVVRAMIRSMRGGTASMPCTLLLSRPARYLLPLPHARGTGGSVVFRFRLLDEVGQPVADGTRVTATSTTGARSLHGGCRNGIVTFDAPEAVASRPFVIEANGIRDTISLDTAIPEASFPMMIVDATSGDGIALPQATASGRGAVRGDARGVLHVPHTWRGLTLILVADGYRPAAYAPAAESSGAGQATDDIVGLTPIFHGCIRGKRIALDAAGGGSDHAGLGPRKLRGASINLTVMKQVRDMLKRAGCTVKLTRSGEETLSAEERIHLVNSSRSDLAISIHHGTTPGEAACRILHYPGSARGENFAASLAAMLRELPPCTEYITGESAAAFLQQTSCPACEIHAGRVGEASTESILANPRYIHLIAERILSAIIMYLGNGCDTWLERTIAVRYGGRPVQGAAVCIDQAVSMTTDSRGCARFTCIDSGLHALTIEAPGRAEPGMRFVEFRAEGSDTLIIDLTPSVEK